MTYFEVSKNWIEEFIVKGFYLLYVSLYALISSVFTSSLQLIICDVNIITLFVHISVTASVIITAICVDRGNRNSKIASMLFRMCLNKMQGAIEKGYERPIYIKPSRIMQEA